MSLLYLANKCPYLLIPCTQGILKFCFFLKLHLDYDAQPLISIPVLFHLNLPRNRDLDFIEHECTFQMFGSVESCRTDQFKGLMVIKVPIFQNLIDVAYIEH